MGDVAILPNPCSAEKERLTQLPTRLCTQIPLRRAECYHSCVQARPDSPYADAPPDRDETELPSLPADAFGDLLRQHRLAAGLSQSQLAELAGLSARGISDLERGVKTRPHRDTFQLLANALQLAPTERAALVTALRGSMAAGPDGRSRRSGRGATRVPVKSGNLPIQLTSFIGRARELHDIKEQLASTRLLTITGPGGCGKTRLALQVAESAGERFADGVWLVELAPLTDPRLVPAVVARVLGLREQAQRSLVETIQEYLRPRETLLLLDNCEHLADACAILAALLLRSCPRLTILATSREPLRVSGETQVPLVPLATPDAAGELAASDAFLARLRDYDSVSLFVERAQAVDRDFRLTAENGWAVAGICRRLDGLPLAIELAASRLRVLPPRAMLDRMGLTLPLLTGGARDLPARQRTLRDTIAWSYDLLSSDEQLLFRRLGLFRGFDLGAADAVGAAVAAQPGSSSVAVSALHIGVLDGVSSLVEKNLLREVELPDGQPWYFMLETVREFAQEQLAASGEADAIQRRHILYYLKLAETAEPETQGPNEARWLARLEREIDNLRTALDWCEARGYGEPATRLALALWWFWLVRGHVTEGRQRLDALIARFPLREVAGRRAADRAKLLRAAATLASVQGDAPIARAVQEEGLAIARTIGDAVSVCGALESLVGIASRQGDEIASRDYANEFLAQARAIGDEGLLCAALVASANVYHEQGDLAIACMLAEEGAERAHALASGVWIVACNLTLAVVLNDLGDTTRAVEVTKECLAVAKTMALPRHIALALTNLGSFALARGELDMARARFAESLAIQRDQADDTGVAFVLERFAGLAVAEGQYLRAISLVGAATALRESAGSPLLRGAQARLDESLSPAWASIGKAVADEARRMGYHLTTEQAIDLALNRDPDQQTVGGKNASVSRRS